MDRDQAQPLSCIPGMVMGTLKIQENSDMFNFLWVGPALKQSEERSPVNHEQIKCCFAE